MTEHRYRVSGGWRLFWSVIVPQLLVIVVTLGLFAAGADDAGAMVGPLGSALAMAGSLAYIVFFDSKQRWPDDSPFQRWTNIATFDYRDRD